MSDPIQALADVLAGITNGPLTVDRKHGHTVLRYPADPALYLCKFAQWTQEQDTLDARGIATLVNLRAEILAVLRAADVYICHELSRGVLINDRETDIQDALAALKAAVEKELGHE